MQQWLQGYLDGTISPGELVIIYHIGDEFSGETDVQLHGDGAYRMWSTVTVGRARRAFTGQVSRSDVRAIVQALLSAQIWDVRHVRNIPGDDDPEAIIAVQRGDGREEVILWVSEIDKRPSFAEAQQAILDLIRTVSSGEVLEVGR
jgi:hypothetical protein